MKAYLDCAKEIKEIMKELVQSMDFELKDDLNEAEVLFLEPPFPIEKPATSKFYTPSIKTVFFIPRNIIELIKKQSKANFEYLVLIPEPILDFFKFVKMELKIED